MIKRYILNNKSYDSPIIFGSITNWEVRELIPTSIQAFYLLKDYLISGTSKNRNDYFDMDLFTDWMKKIQWNDIVHALNKHGSLLAFLEESFYFEEMR